MSFFEALKMEWSGSQLNVTQADTRSIKTPTTISKVAKPANDIILASSKVDIKNDYERKKTYSERKHALRDGRLEVFRILLWRFLKDPKCRDMVNFKCESRVTKDVVENYLDSELLNFDYDLEELIGIYAICAPFLNTSTDCKCGYRKACCSCDISKKDFE